MHYFFLFPCTLHWVGKFRRMATSITSLLLLSSFAKPPPFFCTTASKPYFAPLGGELHYCSLCTRCSQQSLSFLNMRINLWFKFLYLIFMSLSVNCETRYTSWSGSWSKSTSFQYLSLSFSLFHAVISRSSTLSMLFDTLLTWHSFHFAKFKCLRFLERRQHSNTLALPFMALEKAKRQPRGKKAIKR